jgi:hypothetical protein
MTTCIDLLARFGHRYRVAYELPPDLRTEAHGWPREQWPWLARIACRYGHVGAQGGDRLYAFTARPRIGAQLRALPFIERAQGDVEVRVVFHVDHLAEVLAILRPRTRRQVSAAERERLATVGSAALARHRAGGNVQSDLTAPETTQDVADGESDIPA